MFAKFANFLMYSRATTQYYSFFFCSWGALIELNEKPAFSSGMYEEFLTLRWI